MPAPIDAQRGVPRYPQGHPALAKGAPAFKPLNRGLKLLGDMDRPAYEARKAAAAQEASDGHLD